MTFFLNPHKSHSILSFTVSIVVFCLKTSAYTPVKNSESEFQTMLKVKYITTLLFQKAHVVSGSFENLNSKKKKHKNNICISILSFFYDTGGDCSSSSFQITIILFFPPITRINEVNKHATIVCVSS